MGSRYWIRKLPYILNQGSIWEALRPYIVTWSFIWTIWTDRDIFCIIWHICIPITAHRCSNYERIPLKPLTNAEIIWNSSVFLRDIVKSSNDGSVFGSFPYRLQASCRIRPVAIGWVNASCFTCQCIWFRNQHACQCTSRWNFIRPVFQGFKWLSLLITTWNWYWFFNIT